MKRQKRVIPVLVFMVAIPGFLFAGVSYEELRTIINECSPCGGDLPLEYQTALSMRIVEDRTLSVLIPVRSSQPIPIRFDWACQVSKRWIFATFTEGHFTGNMLIEYRYLDSEKVLLIVRSVDAPLDGLIKKKQFKKRIIINMEGWMLN